MIGSRWPAAPGAAGWTVASIGVLPPDAVAAVAATGGHVLGAFGWDAVDELAQGALVIAAVPDDIGHGPLERLAATLDEAGLDAVVACGLDALDAVAAVLLTPRVTLLCDPSPGDWATALALAAHRANASPASVREGADDRDRLRRLNEEVARIAALLAGLVQDEAPATVDDRRRGYRAEPSDAPVDAPVDSGVIRQTIRARRLRAQFVDARLIEDPGWDMLLDLFASELEGGQVSVSSLCIAAAVAPTTALRWITRMVAEGLFVRAPDAEDKRRVFLTLTPHASAAMRGYVGAARRAGVPVV